MVDFHGIDFMEPLDISTIFGNAIDNAIEASENLPEYKRLITVKAERVRDMLLITIENNTQPGKPSDRGNHEEKTALCMALVFPTLKGRRKIRRPVQLPTGRKSLPTENPDPVSN